MTDTEYFETGIRDDAKRAGIDARGLVGMAIVHTMADRIQELEGALLVAYKMQTEVLAKIRSLGLK